MSTAARAERTLPHNLDAERSVLGAILLHNDAFNLAAEVINSSHFFRDAHRRIFEKMITLSERGGERNREAIVALTPNGRVAALAHSSQGSSGDPGIALVDTETGNLLQTLEGHARGVRVLTFNADGTRLASASDDETVKLWDTATGQEVLSRQSLPNIVDIGFTRDGRKLIAVGQDGTTRIWQAGS